MQTHHSRLSWQNIYQPQLSEFVIVRRLKRISRWSFCDAASKKLRQTKPFNIHLHVARFKAAHTNRKSKHTTHTMMSERTIGCVLCCAFIHARSNNVRDINVSGFCIWVKVSGADVCAVSRLSRLTTVCCMICSGGVDLVRTQPHVTCYIFIYFCFDAWYLHLSGRFVWMQII